MNAELIGIGDVQLPESPYVTATATEPQQRRNIPAQADTNRQKRRALVKALGSRQFKKLYRKAQE